jgi:hypothetical protein
MLNCGAVDRILWMGVLCIVTWCLRTTSLYMYLFVLYAYINEMHCLRSKIPSKKSRPYIYIYIYVKFLALLGAPHICDISRPRVKISGPVVVSASHFYTLSILVSTDDKLNRTTLKVYPVA